MITSDIKTIERVIALDCHPDTFTAALLRGQTPAQALTEQVFNQVPLSRLQSWATKHTTEADLFVLEASGNSFHVVRSLAAIGRKARVLESGQLGKLKEAHANNDRISAVRIGKAYLAGTAKEVWVPDTKTQERRDLFHSHRKAVQRTTQIRNRIRSYLSDHGVRLKPGTRLAQGAEALEQLRKLHDWSQRQWQVLEGLHLELRHAEEQRARWRRLITQEVLADEQLLSLVRLCGIRELIAFALGAVIGDIKRFAEPAKLVKYVGLNPAFDDSGNSQWTGGIAGHGRSDLRSLLIEAAQGIFRSRDHAWSKWGRRLLARKSQIKLAVAAVARKLTVAVWYLLMGRWTPVQEIDEQLTRKVGTMITHLGKQALEELGKTRDAFREEIYQTLKTTKLYVLDPDKKMPRKA